MPVFRISYKFIPRDEDAIKKSPQFLSDPDGTFKSIIEGIDQKGFLQIGEREWLIKYDSENKILRERLEKKFTMKNSRGETIQRKVTQNDMLQQEIFDKFDTVCPPIEGNALFSLEYCISQAVSKDNIVIYPIDTKKTVEILRWIEENISS